jgi:hypothetical protein
MSSPSSTPFKDWIWSFSIGISKLISTCLPSTGSAITKSIINRYTQANVVYFIYCFVIIYVDLVLQPAVAEAYALASDDDYYYAPGEGSYSSNDYSALLAARYKDLYDAYKAAAFIHLFNAFQYIFVWFSGGYGLLSIVQIPEFLNVIGASVYVYTSFQYEKLIDATDPLTIQTHKLETFASAVELCAAFGWIITWWLTYPRGVVGRGWTLDDFDLWGNVFIFVPSVIYLVYNVAVLKDPPQYYTNFLYTDGNILFAVGSVVYLLSSLRDDGWLDWLPTGGACVNGIDATNPIDLAIPFETSPYDDIESGTRHKKLRSLFSQTLFGSGKTASMTAIKRQPDSYEYRSGESSSLLSSSPLKTYSL